MQSNTSGLFFHRNKSSVHSICEHPADHRSTVTRPEQIVCKDTVKGAEGGSTYLWVPATIKKKDKALICLHVSRPEWLAGWAASDVFTFLSEQIYCFGWLYSLFTRTHETNFGFSLNITGQKVKTFHCYFSRSWLRTTERSGSSALGTFLFMPQK